MSITEGIFWIAAGFVAMTLLSYTWYNHGGGR